MNIIPLKKARKIVKTVEKHVAIRIFEPVYRFDLLFVAGCSFDTAKIELGKSGIKNLPLEMGNNTGCMINFCEQDFPEQVKGVVYFIWVKSLRDYYTLVHEIAHLIIKVFEEKGLAINSQTTEAFAFYQEFWTQKLWKLMSKK